MATAIDWMKAKWAALSRLPADSPATQLPLPFMDEHSRAKLDLPPASQEAKMLEANSQQLPSDTASLPIGKSAGSRTPYDPSSDCPGC